jgi:hypothetical protein
MSALTQRIGAALGSLRKTVPWLLAAASLPSVVRLVGDRGMPWAVMLTAVLPLVAPILVLLTLIAALLRNRDAMVAGLVVLALNAMWLAPLWISDDPPRSGTKIVAMTLNMRYGLAAPSKIIDQVEANKVELLALTELTPQAVSTLQADGLNRLLPYQVLSPGDDADIPASGAVAGSYSD